MKNTEIHQTPPEEGKPPVFQTWHQLYIFVLILHVVLITILYFFTQHHS